MPESRAHGGAQRLGVERVGGAAQDDSARCTQGVRRADERAHVPRVLHAVDDQSRAAHPAERDVVGRPGARFDDRDDALRCFRVPACGAGARRALFHRHGVPLRLHHQLAAARRAGQVRGDQGATEGQARRERFLHEAHPFDQGEPAPAARLAPLKIADRRLQITGNGSPHGFGPGSAPSICEEAALQSAPPARRRRAPDGARVKIALTIAGADSGGGAGIQADLKTFHQFGVFGTSVITAVTAQNTVGVRAWQALPAELVTRQLDAVADDLPPAAVKSGMLGSGQLVETVAAGIARRRLPSYVLDPVMVATSGDRLLDRDAEQLIARRLVPPARLATPDLDEAAILTVGEARPPADMERAGRALLELGARAALVKGGHLAGDQVVDVLVSDGTVRPSSRPPLRRTSTHGTG